MQFLVLATDYTDPEALNRRLSVREEHLTRVRPFKESGHFIVGGAKLTKDDKMFGSMMVIDFPTIEEAKAWLADDPYVKGNVWETYEVIPFRIAKV